MIMQAPPFTSLPLTLNHSCHVHAIRALGYLSRTLHAVRVVMTLDDQASTSCYLTHCILAVYAARLMPRMGRDHKRPYSFVIQ